MLTVRDQQIDAMGAALLARFALQLLPGIRSDFVDALAPPSDAALLQRIQAALQSARRHGVESDRGLRAYVELDFLLWPSLDRHPDFEALFIMPVEEPVLINNLLAVAGLVIAEEEAAG